MQNLEALAKHAAKFPSQGEATVYGTLNMHVEPYRVATSFYQVNEGTRMAVWRTSYRLRMAHPERRRHPLT